MRKSCKHTSGKTRMVDISFGHGEPDLVEVEDTYGWHIEGVCEQHACVVLLCPVCGCNRYGGWGPVDCPCWDSVPYMDMRPKPKVAVKPSLPTNGVRRRKNRRIR